MVCLIRKLWTDEVGSSLSAEMSLVTSVTVGALFMGMSQFSATVNREFRNSAESAGLTVSDLELDEDDDEKSETPKSETDNESESPKPKGWRFRRAEDRE